MTGKTISADSVKLYKGHHLSVTCVALTQDGKYAFTGSKDCTISKCKIFFRKSKILGDVETGKKIFTFPGGRYFLLLFFLISRHANQKSSGHSGQVLALAISSDGKFLASAGKDQTIKIWDAIAQKLIDTFKGHRDIISVSLMLFFFLKNEGTCFSSWVSSTI